MSLFSFWCHHLLLRKILPNVRTSLSVHQGHPTTVSCKISLRRSTNCLQFSIPWGKLRISRWPFHSCMYNFRILSNKFPTILWSLIFGILPPRLSYFRRKRKPKIFGLKNAMERGIRKILSSSLIQNFWEDNTEALVTSKRLKLS